MTASREADQAEVAIFERGVSAATGRDGAGESRLSTRRQLELLRDLQRLANERAREEARIREALTEGLRAAEEARDRAAEEITRQFNERRTKAADDYEQATSEARRRYEEANKLIDQWWRDRPSDPTAGAIWDFRIEARELMGLKDGKK